MRVRFTKVSSNAKTGPIAVSMTESKSCPDTCQLKTNGCYAKTSFVGIQWRQLDNGTHGIEWQEFISQLSSLPYGSIFRHNVAGDLPHENGIILGDRVKDLVYALKRKTGFTYTHHNVVDNANNLSIVKSANKRGFTINASCDNLNQVDRVMALGIPTATILPEVSDKVTYTPAGNKVVTCPATYNDKIQCANCGAGRPLCARADRGYAIGFPVHGTGKKKAEKVFMFKQA
jgi:hypothetical protein